MERIKKALEKARSDPLAWSAHKESDAAMQRFTQRNAPAVSSTPATVVPIDPVSLERHRIIAGSKEDPRAAYFDILRTQVLQEMRKNGFRTLALTSPMPACGKTTIAVNLALSIAKLAEPTILLGDLDLRRPKIGEYLGLRTDHGLSDFLEGRVALEGVLVDPGIARLLVLPNTKVYRNAAEMLTTPAMKSLVEALKSDDTARVNLFDLPPMLPTDDTIAFLPQVDCVLLVVEDGSTKKSELEETLRLLDRTALLGVVLNKSDMIPRAYY